MKIKYKLSLLNLFIIILFTGAVSAITFISVKRIILNSRYEHLSSVSDIKAQRLKELVKNKVGLASTLSYNYVLALNLDSSDVNSESGNFQTFFNRVRRNVPDVRKIVIVGMDGEVKASTSPALVNKRFTGKRTFEEASKGKKYFGNLRQTESGKYLVSASVPVVSDDKQIAVLQAEFYATDILSLTSNYTGLGETGETMLVKNSSDPEYITPLRFNDTLKGKKIKNKDELAAILKGIKGNSGFLDQGIDYRGKSFIASYDYIPEPGWVVVSKMDRSEIMSPIEELRKVLLIINLVVLIGGLVLSYFLGKRIASPVESLMKSVRKMKEGDLSVNINVKRSDEIGELASSFNEMRTNIKESQNQLKESNQALNQFAYVVSHDLKAPLNSFEGLLGILKEERKEMPESEKEVFSMLFSSVEDMKKLIYNVLNSAKTGAKDKKVEVNTFEVVNSIVKIFDPAPNMQVNVSPTLPVIMFPETAIRRIFQNLIGNAIKYNDKKEGKVEVTCKKVAGELSFCVSDNGPGVSEKEQKKIFRMFQTSSGDDTKESSGIGLSIVQKLVTENGGRIWVKSEPGKGSSFFFTVPVSKSIISKDKEELLLL